ncbi:MAG: hypothetical protein AAFN42_24070 [Cyanobacteria bacterium J06554_1]
MVLCPVDGATASSVGRYSHDYYDHSALTAFSSSKLIILFT